MHIFYFLIQIEAFIKRKIRKIRCKPMVILYIRLNYLMILNEYQQQHN